IGITFAQTDNGGPTPDTVGDASIVLRREISASTLAAFAAAFEIFIVLSNCLSHIAVLTVNGVSGRARVAPAVGQNFCRRSKLFGDVTLFTQRRRLIGTLDCGHTNRSILTSGA